MNLYLDTEFDGDNLLSLALVGPPEKWFYVEVEHPTIQDPWVEDNVLPYMKGEKLLIKDAKLRLSQYLNKMAEEYGELTIVADWPSDLVFFNQMLITGPGKRFPLPPLKFELVWNLPGTSEFSHIPHNALADAEALQFLYENQ